VYVSHASGWFGFKCEQLLRLWRFFTFAYILLRNAHTKRRTEEEDVAMRAVGFGQRARHDAESGKAFSSMKSFVFIVALLVGLTGPVAARGPDVRWQLYAGRDDGDQSRAERFAERRERMRSLREEMQRPQPRPAYRDEDARPLRPERREFARPPDREFRRMSPEQRQQFRRQLHQAGRDAYRDR
jgi:hypothetical protein